MNNKTELRASISLSLIFFLRMFGIFIILPIFILYEDHYIGATPSLMGIALGCYGLTQAIFQIPFGMMSDRFGRKPVIGIGLLVFILGSVIAAYADSIYLLIAGRALQGAGAIAAAIMALAADLTRESTRSRTMALIGIGIGMAFALSLVAGPVLSGQFNIYGLFFISAGLGVIALLVLFILVPDTHIPIKQDKTGKVTSLFSKVIKNRQLQFLCLSIMILHILMMSSFIAIPVLLAEHLGLDKSNHWYMYLPALILSAVIIFPMLSLVEKLDRVKTGMIITVFLMICAQFGFGLIPASFLLTLFLMLLFFTAFNFMEASLPSLVTRTVLDSFRGTALGFYSTSQFIGTFLGGVMGGLIYEYAGLNQVFLFDGGLCIIWLVLMVFNRNFKQQQDFTLKLGKLDKQQEELIIKKILAVDGVTDAMFIAEDGIAYLKVNQSILDYEALNAISMKTI